MKSHFISTDANTVNGFFTIEDSQEEEIIPLPDEHSEGEADIMQCEPSTSSQSQKVEATLAEKLLYFFHFFSISHRAMEYLLASLREEGIDVPASVYLLRKCEKSNKQSIILKSVLDCGGNLAYLSIKDNICFCLRNGLIYFSEKFNIININLNIDGMPLFRSSPVTLWPILMSFKDLNFKKPLPVAIYSGGSKPDFSDFIKNLCDELEEFMDYILCDNFYVKLGKIVFVCDSPARSFLQGTKSHSGYYACSVCRIKENIMERR